MRTDASNQIERNRVVSGLVAPALALAASSSLEEGFDAVLDAVAAIVPFETCALRVLDRERKELVLVAHRGLTRRHAQAINRVQFGQGPPGRVAMLRRPLLVEDRLEEGLPPSVLSRLSRGRLPMRCYIGVPLGREELLGVLGAGRDHMEPFSVEDLTCLDLIGGQIGIALTQVLLGKGEEPLRKDLYSFGMQVIRREEQERARLAQDLHDTTLQDLIVICHRLKGLLQGEHGFISDGVKSNLETTLAHSYKVVEGVRNLSRDLRPSILGNIGLVGAINWLAEQLEEEHKIAARVKVTGRERRLFALHELAVFRVAQEALNNVRKHSCADSVLVHLSFAPKTLIMVIQDNGKGFQMPKGMEDLVGQGKLGLIGMRERVGDLRGAIDITSQLGKGTRISVQVPT